MVTGRDTHGPVPPRLVGRGGLGKVTEGGCERLWYDVFTREGMRDGS